MNVERFENEVHKKAVKAHTQAQNAGSATLYTKAAELYEQSGDWDMAAACRDAAQILRTTEEAA